MAKAIAKPAISAEQKQKNKKQLRIQIKRDYEEKSVNNNLL